MLFGHDNVQLNKESMIKSKPWFIPRCISIYFIYITNQENLEDDVQIASRTYESSESQVQIERTN